MTSLFNINYDNAYYPNEPSQNYPEMEFCTITNGSETLTFRRNQCGDYVRNLGWTWVACGVTPPSE
jgi:hypothetical protein